VPGVSPRLILLAAVAVALLAATAQPARSARYTCAGAPDDYPHLLYPEKRVFLESQAWWTKGKADPLTSGKAHHVHLGLCFPQGRVAHFRSGRIRWDFRILFHHMIGYKATQLRGAWQEKKLGRTCSSEDCQWYVTSWGSKRDESFPHTRGRKEVRPKVRVKTPDGFEMFQSAGWHLILTQGRRKVNDRPTNSVIGRGWYTDFGYANVGMQTYRAPGPQLSGVWTTPRVRAVAGADGRRVTSHLFTIDPDFHMGDQGIVVRRGKGGFDGRLRIDPVALNLGSGVHKLVLVANSRHVRGRRPNGTNTAVEVLPFMVD
jgi:hypothetical protein